MKLAFPRNAFVQFTGMFDVIFQTRRQRAHVGWVHWRTGLTVLLADCFASCAIHLPYPFLDFSSKIFIISRNEKGQTPRVWIPYILSDLMHRKKNYHSNTASARTSTDGGIAMPSAFAVLALIASSNLVGCSIGTGGLRTFEDFDHDRSGLPPHRRKVNPVGQ